MIDKKLDHQHMASILNSDPVDLRAENARLQAERDHWKSMALATAGIVGGYAAVRSPEGVWMADVQRCESVARMIAVEAMQALGLDSSDFRMRDKVICGIADRVDKTLDFVAESEGRGIPPEPSASHKPNVISMSSHERS